MALAISVVSQQDLKPVELARRLQKDWSGNKLVLLICPGPDWLSLLRLPPPLVYIYIYIYIYALSHCIRLARSCGRQQSGSGVRPGERYLRNGGLHVVPALGDVVFEITERADAQFVSEVGLLLLFRCQHLPQSADLLLQLGREQDTGMVP